MQNNIKNRKTHSEYCSINEKNFKNSAMSTYYILRTLLQCCKFHRQEKSKEIFERNTMGNT